MPFQIVRHDITKMKVDAIVNAANPALKMGGGVCGAIFSAAGKENLQAECDRIGGCKTGQAVITGGYDLPAKYIIHTVGPIWSGGNHDEPRLLYDCYTNSMILALQYKCSSVAFPLISSGIYGYPTDQALKIATAAITDFLLDHDLMVYLVVFDKKALAISEKLFAEIDKFIDDNYVEDMDARFVRDRELQYYEIQDAVPSEVSMKKKAKRRLSDLIDELDESFSQMVLRLIDEKGLTDVQTYKRANLNRKLFSKIRTGKGYNPSKPTALALAIALQLNLDQTSDLLRKAGYTLSHSHKFDVIIEYFITEGRYDINEINQVLFHYDQSLLGL